MKSMKKTWIAVLLALALCAGMAAAEEPDWLGQPFPDFTATDTQGNTFTLSEALKDHEAVLLNIWATWCPPCRAEFPDLNEVYAAYGDRVAFIALSCEEEDTLEEIEEFRQNLGLNLPMGRDEGGKLSSYINSAGIPTTVVIDRFGNSAFCRVGSFASAGEVSRVLDAFLGDGYTETNLLTEIPPDSSTRSFPVSSARALRLENENAQLVAFRMTDTPETLRVYVVNDDTAHLLLEAGPNDNPAAMIYYDQGAQKLLEFPALLNAERNAYVYDQPLPGLGDEVHFAYGVMVDYSLTEGDPEGIEIYMLPNEDYIQEMADLLTASGHTDVTWTYEEDPAPQENSAPQAYVLHVMDQFGEPVPGVMVNFCTDTACTMCQSDGQGTITFDGPPDIYHVQLLKVPDGYSFDADFDMHTGLTYGEWALRIRKN